jgi:hypothetical protein
MLNKILNAAQKLTVVGLLGVTVFGAYTCGDFAHHVITNKREPPADGQEKTWTEAKAAAEKFVEEQKAQATTTK